MMRSRTLRPFAFTAAALASVVLVPEQEGAAVERNYGAGARVPSLPGARDSLDVVFLANMGVVLRSPGARVLIDALYGAGLPGYGIVSGRTQDALHRAVTPFDSVDFVLATHGHRDHFDPNAVLAHLRANPRGTFVAGADVVARLHAADSIAARELGRRLISVTVAPGSRRRVVSNAAVTVDALGMTHGQTPHVAYLLEIGGQRVLHVGDTDDDRDELAVFQLRSEGIDVALLPYWYLTSGEHQRAVREAIDPRAIMVLHTPAPGYETASARSLGGWRAAVREIQRLFPNARIPERELETFRVPQ